MKKFYNIKNLFNYIKLTPVHPQWFVFRRNKKNLCEIASFVKGQVLDIGCDKKIVKKYLPESCRYIGLDYYQTAAEWYDSKPDVYGDAQNLFFSDNSIDSVLLLDVLEHLPDPERCLSEINRVLIKEGVFIILVPFLYPIHDAPLDFHRWTIFGLRNLVQKHNFKIVEEKHEGNPIELAGLLFNIALSKTVLNWARKKNPAALLIIFLPIVVFVVNISSFILSCLSPQDEMMPWGYRLVLEKEDVCSK